MDRYRTTNNSIRQLIKFHFVPFVYFVVIFSLCPHKYY